MTDVQIAFGWNAYQSCKASTCTSAWIEEQGIHNWVDTNLVISIFFYVAATGVFNLSVISDSIQRSAELLVSIPSIEKSFYPRFQTDSVNMKIGTIKIQNPGYIRVDFKGTKSLLNRKAGNYPALKYLKLSGVKDTSKVNFVQESFSSHFGRRGPSVHLSYNLESSENIQYFYNEVTVPRNQDKIGTYAMAIGFNGGYFGMQVNSASERRILFSVWSPQDTNDPNSVLPENAVLLVEKGKDTIAKEFGGEGSGGQSYMVYPWVAGVAYQFKLEGKPVSDGYSQFTAYFKDPTKHSDYILIASWRQPKSQTYLKGLYSFLENFSPETGNISRKVYFNNQQTYDNEGNKINVPSASFSYDTTADEKQRFDYDGGVEGQKGYYLKNCGFFNKTAVKYGDIFIKNKK